MDWYLTRGSITSWSEGADIQIFNRTSFITCRKVGTYFTASGMSSLYSWVNLCKEITTATGQQPWNLLITRLHYYFHTSKYKWSSVFGHFLIKTHNWPIIRPFTNLCWPVCNKSLFTTWLMQFYYYVKL